MIDVEKLENIISELEEIHDELREIANDENDSDLKGIAGELNDSIIAALDDYMYEHSEEEEE